LLFRVGLVDGEEKRTPGLSQQANEFEIGPGKFGTPINDHDDGGSLIKGDSRLSKNLGRNEILCFGKDSAGIDDPNAAAAPFGITVQAISGNAGLVANNGTARPHDAIEQGGLAYIGPAYDGERWNASSGGSESAGRVVSGLSQNER